MRTIPWLHLIPHAWQHRQIPWPSAVWKVLLVAVVCGLGAFDAQGHAGAAGGATGRVPDPAPAQAMANGQEAFQQGDFEGAALSWQTAARLYANTKQPQAHSLALTHLARAYAALGHDDQAVQSLRTALRLTEEAGALAQRARILGELGNLALATGNVAEAERLVSDALTLARPLGQAELTATLLHTRGNLLMAQQQPHEALAVYRNSAALAQQAQQAGMRARAQAHAALAAVHTAQSHTATTLLDDALTHLRQAESSHDTAYDLLFIGRVYHRLATTDPALVLRAATVFQEAAALAQTLQDRRALSYAWGYLGRLYEEEHRYQEALELTRRAVLAVQQVYVPESLALWQWQTGRVLRALGDFQAALEAYERALATVQSMRPALLRGAERTPTGFRTSWGPLYFELADLFLRRAAALEARDQEAVYPQYEWYLYQARSTVEQFKTAELRDYFGDECVAAVQPRSTALERVSPDTMIVYPILLPDRTDVLVSLPTGIKRVQVPVAGSDLEQRVRIFRNALQDRDPLRYLQHAQALYTWLIRPLEAAMAAQHIQTLVFVPDGALRLLPFAALHDGQQFLIEQYALAITPSLTLTDPRPLPPGKVQVLAAGVSSAVAGFPPLPWAAEELYRVQRVYGGTVLLEQDFSPERLDTTLRQGAFGIVHIAAHGQFAPEAAASFLLTAQGKLTMERLSQIVGRLRFRDHPLELLTLSACETASGDDRAALGLAGVALQAGARSAVATLWLVHDAATAVLMEAFYRSLQTQGVSRARALQQAQRTLLQDPTYADPFFWAPFLLINNWL
jgi:CHAT domain-containing protein